MIPTCPRSSAPWTSCWPLTSRIPAVVVDRSWSLVAGNRSVALFTEGVAADLLAPPANVLRLSLHPDGLAPRILNLPQWRRHVLHRLAREAHLTGDPQLAPCIGSCRAARRHGPDAAERHRRPAADPARGTACCHFLSTVTTFGTAVDLTAAELSIEAFLPADAATADVLPKRSWSGDTGSGFRGVVTAP